MESTKKNPGKGKPKSKGGGDGGGGNNKQPSGGSVVTASSNAGTKKKNNPGGTTAANADAKNTKSASSNNQQRRRQRRRGGAERHGHRRGSGGGIGGRIPPSPALKVTIRNVSNVFLSTPDVNDDSDGTKSSFRTCEGLCDGFLRTLIQRANERIEKTNVETQSLPKNANSIVGKSSALLAMVLDETDITRIISEEAAAIKVRNEWEASRQIQQQQQQQTQAEEGKVKDLSNNDLSSASMKGENDVAKVDDDVSKTSNNKNETAIQVRLLYAYPPRRTRRRGEKPGCMYMVLTAPPIVPIILKKQMVSTVPSDSNKNSSNSKASTISYNSKASTADPDAIVVAPDDPTECTGAGESTVGADGNESTASSGANKKKTKLVLPKKNPVPSATPIDYTREVAKQKILLQHALQALIDVAAEDSKISNKTGAPPSLADCVIEESTYAKVWKPSSKNTPSYRPSRDRLEGTILDSSDYKEFLEKQAKEKEERMARPKPAPGGGVNIPSGVSGKTSSSAPTAGTNGSSGAMDSNNNPNQQPIAALVLHLQKKQEEEKKRKQQTKTSAASVAASSSNKKKDSKSSSKNDPNDKSSSKKKSSSEGDNTGATNTQKKKNARKRGGVKKQGAGGGNNAAKSDNGKVQSKGAAEKTKG